MKKDVFLLVLLIIFLLSACKEQMIVSPIGVALSDNAIQIKVNNFPPGLDTVRTEKNLRTVYRALALKGVKIVSWLWIFSENNSTYIGPRVEFWHNLNPGVTTKVTLLGTDNKGCSHITSVNVKIVYSLDGLPGLLFISSTPMKNGLYSVVFAAHKNALRGIKGPYGYTGSFNSWKIQRVAAIDTNFNWSGHLVPASNGVGKFIEMEIKIFPADYEIHAGKIDLNGNLIWAINWGPYQDGKFTLHSDGRVSPR